MFGVVKQTAANIESEQCLFVQEQHRTPVSIKVIKLFKMKQIYFILKETNYISMHILQIKNQRFIRLIKLLTYLENTIVTLPGFRSTCLAQGMAQVEFAPVVL
jgi:hypothetical protein